MQVIYRFVTVLPENEKSYFSVLEGLINSVDEFSTLEIRRNLDNYSFRIATSSPIYRSSLIEELNKLHNLFRIKVDFSKSMKTTSTISYKINFVN